MDWEYRVVDVFTKNALEGNPLAVFTDARGLDGATMQRIALELNLSETSFILPAEREGAPRVRIFTPHNEMKFAGHPTIGTAFVLLDEGIVPPDATDFALHENIGLVAVRVEHGATPMIWLRTPAMTVGGTYERSRCARALGLSEGDLLDGVPCGVVSAGNPALFVPLRDPSAVDRIDVDTQALRQLMSERGEFHCFFPFAPTPQGAYSRMFAPELGVVEDPATGSVTGPLALFMMHHGLVSSADGTRFVSEQGTKMGRRSLLHVQVHGEMGKDGIDVGGHVTPIARATMQLRDRTATTAAS